jgi:hypothetical protein
MNSNAFPRGEKFSASVVAKVDANRAAMKCIDIDDSDYVRSHGTTPRGRGSWAFATDAASRRDAGAPTMTYSDAKVWAKAKARDMLAQRSTAPLCNGASITLYTQP